MYYRIYKLSKTWLEHSQKTTNSEIPLRVKVLKGLKHFWNLHESPFIIFSHQSENKWFGRYIPYWNLISWECLLTHWLPMTSILFVIVRICRSLFKRNYLKNEKVFPTFLLIFWNLHQVLKIFSKKIIVIANIFPQLKTVKNLIRALSNKRCFRTSFDCQHVKGSQTLVKSRW